MYLYIHTALKNVKYTAFVTNDNLYQINMPYIYLKPTSYGKMGPGEIGPSSNKNQKSEKGKVSFIFNLKAYIYIYTFIIYIMD